MHVESGEDRATETWYRSHYGLSAKGATIGRVNPREKAIEEMKAYERAFYKKGGTVRDTRGEQGSAENAITKNQLIGHYDAGDTSRLNTIQFLGDHNVTEVCTGDDEIIPGCCVSKQLLHCKRGSSSSS